MFAVIAAVIVIAHLAHLISATFDWSAWAVLFIALELALGGWVSTHYPWR